ncbi:MAG TPA: PTS sugar transporter subunit IIA, partial [Tepidisphaeraceae bacterium]|nr:PTS sugar transporter subunit IIA [Tepidisphaeraceae bacterium]
MRLTEILKPQNIVIPLRATTKTDAIAELIDKLAANGDLTDPKKVLDSVLDREATRTTGIGNGLAIPHGKTAGAGNLTMAIGKP